MTTSSPSQGEDSVKTNVYDPKAVKERLGDKFKFSDSDVIVATYPRSGTNWMCYTLTRMYNDWALLEYENRTVVPLLDYYYRVPPREGTMLSNITQLFLESSSDPRPRRLLKTHLTPMLMPSSWQNCQCKVIYITRDLKDVCISSYYLYRAFCDTLNLPKETWKGFPQRWLQGQTALPSPLTHIASWENYSLKDNVLNIKYEDMKTNFADVISKVAGFLERPLSEDDIQRVVDETGIGKMRENAWKILDFHSSEYRAVEGHQFVGRGEVGSWKHHFTVADNETFDEIVKTHMENMKN